MDMVIIADWLLRVLGENPAAFPQPDDKWPMIFAGVAFYGAPVLLIILFLAPFLYLLIRRKKFSLRNILFALGVGLVLVAAAVYAMYWGIMYLQGLAFKALYGG